MRISISLVLFADPSSSWQHYESILYLLAGTTGTIDTDDSVYLPNIIELLKKVPNHPKIRNTLFTFLGGLGDWLVCHPGHIEELLPFLLSGMSDENKEIMSSCSLSLQDICQECNELLSQESALKILQVCRETLQRSQCPSNVAVRAFQITGSVLSVLPKLKLESELEVMVTPLLHKLKLLLESKNVVPEVYDEVRHCLNCLTALYHSLDPYVELTVHPILLVYQPMIALFPLLKEFCKIETVVLAATGCIYKAVQIAREMLTPFIGATCQILYEFLSIHPQISILNVSALVIGMFGSEKETREVVKHFFEALLASCLNLDGKEYTDCMEGFMDLMGRVIRTVPEFLIGQKEREAAVLKSALVLMTFQEVPTMKNACYFLSSYVSDVSIQGDREVLLSFGKSLVAQLLLCIGATAPRTHLDSYSDILLALNKNFTTELAVWLNELLIAENFPSVVPSNLEKEQFKKSVLREKSSKSRMRELVKHFGVLCRGLHGMPHIIS